MRWCSVRPAICPRQSFKFQSAIKMAMRPEAFHPDNFCDPASAKYRDKYAEIARRPTHAKLEDSWRRARELGLKFETAPFERRNAFGISAMLEI